VPVEPNKEVFEVAPEVLIEVAPEVLIMLASEVVFEVEVAVPVGGSAMSGDDIRGAQEARLVFVYGSSP
jgi:hypothetical protein